MKRQSTLFTILFVVMTLLGARQLQAKPLSCHVTAESAILINADTGKVLFAKNSSQPHYPASMTKVATTLYLLKSYPHLFQQLRCRASAEALRCVPEAQKCQGNYSKYPSYVLETDMSHMGLKVGEEMSFRDLFLGTLIVSADDASNVVAEIAGQGSIERFMQGINRYLAELGLKNTKLMNPHGLHHPEHLSTASDLALLLREAMKDPEYASMVKMSHFNRPKTNKQDAVTLHQTNKLVVKTSAHYYPYALGGKTGYHRRAGHNLVSMAEKDGRRLIAVILHADKRPTIFQESRKLYEAAFNEQTVTKTIMARGGQSFERQVTGGVATVKTYLAEPLSLTFYPSEEPEIRCQLIWDTMQAPVKRGERVGQLQLLADKVVVKAVPLLAANSCEQSFSYALRQKWSALCSSPLFLTALGGVVLALLYVCFFAAKRKSDKKC